MHVEKQGSRTIPDIAQAVIVMWQQGKCVAKARFHALQQRKAIAKLGLDIANEHAEDKVTAQCSAQTVSAPLAQQQQAQAVIGRSVTSS